MADKNELLKAINRAFIPAREVELPQFFSGRESEITRGLHALRSQGASLCIYGPRGIGKTSLAKQLLFVASGYSMLTDMIGRPELFDSDLFCLPTVYFPCDDTITGAEQLFRKILCDRNSLNGICRFNDGVVLKNVRKKTTDSAKLTIRLLESTTETESEKEEVRLMPDPISAFKSVTTEIVDAADKDSIVVAIDEFERVKDKSGIASIIRTCDAVKFIIVGIADDLHTLIEDHCSLKRQLMEGVIKVGLMSDHMLIEIIQRAEMHLRTLEGAPRFGEDVIKRIVSIASGYPHWVHLLGKWSCIDAVEKGEKIVSSDNLEEALRISIDIESDYEAIYRIVVTDASSEAILKLLAYDGEEDHNLSDLFRSATSLGIQSLQWNEQTRTLVDKGVLKKRDGNFATFADKRFKIFAKMRPVLFKEREWPFNWPEFKIRELNTEEWVNFPEEYVENYSIDILDKTYFDASSTGITRSTSITPKWQMSPPIDSRTARGKPKLFDQYGNPIKSRKDAEEV